MIKPFRSIFNLIELKTNDSINLLYYDHFHSFNPHF